jgi:hypothetical protein
MSQRIADASAKVARSFYLLPRMTDNVLFGLSRTMAGLSGEVVQHLNVLKSFSSYSGRQHAEQPFAAVHEAGYGTSRRSQPNINLVAIGGEADMPRPPAPYQSDAIDPNRSLAGLKSRTAARAPATSRCAILSCEARRHWAVRADERVVPGDERCKAIRVVDVACFDREIFLSLELFRMAGDGRHLVTTAEGFRQQGRADKSGRTK